VREAGGELRLVLPETPARRIFEITGLEQVLVVRATRAEALAD
jgi:anti-anti-sigma regulatory factor